MRHRAATARLQSVKPRLRGMAARVLTRSVALYGEAGIAALFGLYDADIDVR